MTEKKNLDFIEFKLGFTEHLKHASGLKQLLGNTELTTEYIINGCVDTSQTRVQLVKYCRNLWNVAFDMLSVYGFHWGRNEFRKDYSFIKANYL